MEIVEMVGSMGIINGRFIVIDQTGNGRDGKEFAAVVNVYDLDENTREAEIDFMTRAVASGSGGKLVAGRTQFNFMDISRTHPRNRAVLKNHEDPTKMVVVKNRQTDEFFLVMSDVVSLREAEVFLCEVNNIPLLLKPDFYQRLSLPHEGNPGKLGTTGNLRFEVVTNGGIAVIKLKIE